jgi:hypothetical protein
MDTDWCLINFRLPPDVHQALKAHLRAKGVTMTAFFQAAVQDYLRDYRARYPESRFPPRAPDDPFCA